jgi:hypothetical protein
VVYETETERVEVCECEPMPVVWMFLPVVGWERWGSAENRNPVLDQAEFVRLGAGMVVLACPECAHVYWSAVP